MLVGKRIKLRPVEEADLPRLVEWRNQPEIWASFFNKFPLAHSGQRAWYQGLSEDRNRLLLIIEDLASHEAAGTVGLDRIDPINRVAEYGNILIGPERFRRQGLAHEATTLILAYGFGRLNLNRIFLHVLEENTQAISLYRKCGFREEGRLRQAFYDEGRYKDVLLMSVLANEFSEGLKSPEAAEAS